MATFDFVLASNSPRRRQLFGWTGWTFTVAPADINETPLPGEQPRAHVLRLAQAKARAAASRAPAADLVLGSDTIVADGSEILGKPVDSVDARRMLLQLRGRTHQVYTALAIFQPQTGRLALDCCQADVPMRAYGTTEMDAYIASGDPLDKAGAYAIQHPGFQPVTDFHGCYACVMGLPLCHLLRLARSAFNLQPQADVPALCRSGLGYDCPIYAQILSNPGDSIRVEE